jgi:ABC-2 type transport system permease protein
MILGGGESKPLNQRFLPLLVLLAIMMSGLMIPSSTLVDEKQRQTLTALSVTPVSVSEVVAAKILLGFILSLFMGVLILVLNGSFGSNPSLLLLSLALAAAFASTFGGLAGLLAGNINTLMTLFKSLMLIMYAPGILTLFPRVPGWIPQLFPTYYVFHPVVEVSQNNAGLRDIGWELLLLIGLIVAMTFVVVLVGRRKKLQIA